MAVYYGIETAVPLAGKTKTLPLDFGDTSHYVVDICKAVVGNVDCGATYQKLTGQQFKIVPGMDLATVEWMVYGGVSGVASTTYEDYMTELESKIKDNMVKLATDDKDRAIAAALSQLSRDKQFVLSVVVTGDGTDTYVVETILGAAWMYGESRVLAIEYPAGESPSVIIDDDDWEVYDNGTALDGSNLVLRFLDADPAATETFIVRASLPYKFPKDGVPNFPNTSTNLQDATNLAAHYCCLKLAAAFAQDMDGTITADVVNMSDKTSRYRMLARDYLKAYNKSVFGEEEPKGTRQAVGKVVDVETRTSEGSKWLFH